jgi:hypothetical protein
MSTEPDGPMTSRTMSDGVHLRTFFDALFAGLDQGLVNLRTLRPKNESENCLPEPEQAFIPVHDFGALKTFLAPRLDRNCYFGVALRTRPDGALTGCGPLPALFVDLDFKDFPSEAKARAALARAPLPPGLVVASGGGLQALWLLREPLDLSSDAPAAKALLRRLARFVGGDLASAEPARVLRLPNTWNLKYEPKRPVRVEVFEPERRYNAAEFDEWLPADEICATPSAAPADGAIPVGRRNAHLTSLAGSMRRRGMSEAALAAALAAENVGRCDPPLADNEVRAIARSVGRYAPAPIGTAAVASDVESRIADEVARLRIVREARRRLDAEDHGPVQEPEFLTLRERLARPRPDVRWRIDGWQPVQSRVMLAAQFKAGKTTLVAALLRSLVDGAPWLGRDVVTPIDGTVALLDTEMAEIQLDEWLRAQRIRQDDRVIVVALRGRVATLDLLDPHQRARWAAWLHERGVAYVVLDCLRPVLDAFALDEHREAGRFLTAFDALLTDAGIPDALIVQHMGHQNERSRGDSRLRDWPDVEWRLVRQNEEPASPRFITAYGRDVDIPESRLEYDPLSRRLTIAGGSRQDAKVEAALDAVCRVLADASERLSGRAIKTSLAESGHPRDTIDAALRLGVTTRALHVEPGANNAKLYSRVRVSGGNRPVSGGHRSECPAASKEPDAGTHMQGPRASGRMVTTDGELPDWVTEPTEPDFSDPIGAHDEERAVGADAGRDADDDAS